MYHVLDQLIFFYYLRVILRYNAQGASLEFGIYMCPVCVFFVSGGGGVNLKYIAIW